MKYLKRLCLTLVAVMACGVLFLAGCGKEQPKLPELPLTLKSKSFGPDAQLTDTHFIVNWPGSTKVEGTPPLTLKIPREFLATSPGAMDKSGHLYELYIDFTMPDVTPWEPKLPEPKEGEKKITWDQHSYSRVLLTLNRTIGETRYYRSTVEVYARSRQRDGVVAGLERYTETICYKDEALKRKRTQDILRTKQADDTTPDGCLLYRPSSFLALPPNETFLGSWVLIPCTNGHCDAHFSVNGRGASVHLKSEQLPEWRERVGAAIRLAESFVVQVPDSN